MNQTAVAEKFGYATITLLAFGVGMLLGARYCEHPEAALGKQNNKAMSAQSGKDNDRQACEPRIIEKTIQAPPKIIYECPPPEPKTLSKAKGVGKQKVKKKADLPPPEPELDPLLRKRLLAWVRDQSESLKQCRDNSKEVYRVAVIMHLKEDHRIRRVDVNADGSQVPGRVSSCIRREILTWRPPAPLVKDQRKLVFGLNI